MPFIRAQVAQAISTLPIVHMKKIMDIALAHQPSTALPQSLWSLDFEGLTDETVGAINDYVTHVVGASAVSAPSISFAPARPLPTRLQRPLKTMDDRLLLELEAELEANGGLTPNVVPKHTTSSSATPISRALLGTPNFDDTFFGELTADLVFDAATNTAAALNSSAAPAAAGTRSALECCTDSDTGSASSGSHAALMPTPFDEVFLESFDGSQSSDGENPFFHALPFHSLRPDAMWECSECRTDNPIQSLNCKECNALGPAAFASGTPTAVGSERAATADGTNPQAPFKIYVKVYDPKIRGRAGWRCEFCGREFKNRSDLTPHFRTHTGEKPYACEHPGCDKSYAHISNLRAHERIHRGQKRHACEVPGCNRTFARRSTLQEHKLTHPDGRVYQCTEPGCTASFTTIVTLARHKKLHDKKDEVVPQAV